MGVKWHIHTYRDRIENRWNVENRKKHNITNIKTNGFCCAFATIAMYYNRIVECNDNVRECTYLHDSFILCTAQHEICNTNSIRIVKLKCTELWGNERRQTSKPTHSHRLYFCPKNIHTGKVCIQVNDPNEHQTRKKHILWCMCGVLFSKYPITS